MSLSPAAVRSRLPAVRFDSAGVRHVDQSAVLALVLPLMLNSTIQLALNLTDTWFIGRLSVDALAAVGAVNFLAIVVILALGGVGIGVQTLVAQAWGAGSSLHASRYAWLGLWASLLVAPLFLVAACASHWLLAPFALPPTLEDMAAAYWFPRLLGAPLAVALWAVTGFFNGIGRTRITFLVMALVALLNAALNQVLMVWLGLGIAGSAWATSISLGVGTAIAIALFVSPSLQRHYRTRLTWRPTRRGLTRVFALGVPTGLFPAVDLAAISLFQLMQVRLGPIPGAATQIVMMLTAIAYLPAIGIAMAGTTLVGQSIGAGDKAWAERLGNRVIVLVMAYMGAVGIGIALGGRWLIPLFTDVSRADGQAVFTLALSLIWIAGAYQLFDALNLACAFCLRGAGDVRIPTLYLMILAWAGFVPLAHMLSFDRSEGWVSFLPQLGWGAVGGWLAALLYIVALGTMMTWRWRSRAWQRVILT